MLILSIILGRKRLGILLKRIDHFLNSNNVVNKGFTIQKTILPGPIRFWMTLESIGVNFGNDFITNIVKRYWPDISDSI